MPALKGTVTRCSTDTDTEPEPFPISTGIPFCQGRFCRSCTSSDRPDIVPPPRCSLDRTQRQTTLTAALFCFFQNSKPNANSANPVASSLLYAIFPGLSHDKVSHQNPLRISLQPLLLPCWFYHTIFSGFCQVGARFLQESGWIPMHYNTAAPICRAVFSL